MSYWGLGKRAFKMILDSESRQKEILQRKHELLQRVLDIHLRGHTGVIHKGRRSHSRVRIIKGQPWVEKHFWFGNDEAHAFKKEMIARDLFGNRAWFPPSKRTGWRSFRRPFYPDDSILYRALPTLAQKTRSAVLGQAMDLLFDIFMAGYAHRDFHAGNLFWINKRLILVDYETIGAYPFGQRPAFPDSYDMTGHGMDSPYYTDNMCFTNSHDWSLGKLLESSYDEGLQHIASRLREKLRCASLSFQKATHRHNCESQKIYSSFTLPYLAITPSEAQRNSDRRLERFGITKEMLKQKRILDLGCNMGGMLFSAQRYLPGQCIGIEFDAEKVQAAREVAAFNGLNNVDFVQSDIDRLTLHKLGGTFDVVFCLALEAHVRKRQRLYRLLSSVTRDVLLFEGNANSNFEEIPVRLRANGFRTVEFLGTCDDDCLSKNNNRPLFLARK